MCVDCHDSAYIWNQTEVEMPQNEEKERKQEKNERVSEWMNGWMEHENKNQFGQK